MDHETLEENDSLELYILNALPDEQRDAVEQHIFACISCADKVKFLARVGTHVHRAFGVDRFAALSVEQQRSFFRSCLLQFLSITKRNSDAAIHMPHVTDFRQLFTEVIYREKDAPPATSISARGIPGRHSHMKVNTIPVGPLCTINLEGSQPIVCYVRCSDEVFHVINRRMPTPPPNSRISFEINVSSNGMAFVSAVNSKDGPAFFLAYIRDETIPKGPQLSVQDSRPVPLPFSVPQKTRRVCYRLDPAFAAAVLALEEF